MRARAILHPAALLAGLLTLAPVHAASITLSGGRVDPGDGYGSTTTANVRVGAELLDLGVAEFDVGVEAARSTTKGEGPGPLPSEYSFTSVGAFVGARTAGPLYLIGQYGVARNEIDHDPGSSERATQHSVGVGIGASAGILQLELMATRYRKAGDIDDVTWVTAGIRF